MFPAVELELSDYAFYYLGAAARRYLGRLAISKRPNQTENDGRENVDRKWELFRDMYSYE